MSNSGIVRGTVVDKDTRKPLHGVYVIYGKHQGTVTGEDGSYNFTAPPGKLSVSYNLIGYEPVVEEIVVEDGVTVSLDISLEMKVSEIGQIVISANKTEQRIAELTVSMDIIRTSFLEDNHITDAQEIINKTPGIEVLDGQASIRGGSGFSYGAGSRVLALIDGLPMVSADAGNIKWQFLPLENISQIEIIKGASSVLYGSSALNGVINFRTADASNIPVTKFFAEAGVFGKPKNRARIWWDTPRIFTSASFSHLQKFGNTDLGISASILHDEGYRRLNGEKLGRVSLKIKHFNNKVEGLTYGLGMHSGYTNKKDFVLWENAGSGALKQSPATASDFHGTFIALDPFISFKKNNHFRHDLRVRAQSSTNRLPENVQNNSDAFSAYSEYQLWYRVVEFIDITAGVSENYSKVNSNFFGDHSNLNIAGFTQAEIKVNTRIKGVAGIRLETNSLDHVDEEMIPVFRAGINWQAADYTFLRASFGQGYRYPSIAEKFAATTLGSIKIIANPDIIPESGWNSELGIKQGLSFGNITGQADMSVFYMHNSNLIEYLFGLYPEAGLGFRATNREESRIYGTELEFHLSESSGILRNTLSGGYTYIYPVDHNQAAISGANKYLKYRRKHSAKISWSAEWRKFDIGLNFFFNSKILNIDDVFLTTPILPGFDEYWPEHNNGYGLLDGSLGYRMNEKLNISLALKNITNTEYMGRPGDIQPQRNVSLRFSGNL